MAAGNVHFARHARRARRESGKIATNIRAKISLSWSMQQAINERKTFRNTGDAFTKR
jgi:hypothetical protein